MRRAFVVASTVVLWFAGVEPAFAQSGPFQKVCVDVVMKSWSAPDPDPEGTVRTNGPTSSPTSKPPPEPEPKRAAPISFAQAGAPRALFAAPRDAWAAPNTPTTAEDSKPAATDATTDAPPIAVELEEALSDAEQEPAKPSVDLRSREVRPELYLKRLIEYEVTHHALYEAVSKDCPHRLTVELYELRSGWTVFARFSRHAREEKVDYVEQDEFASLASRLASALLRDRPISETITRLNVLRADSEANVRSIRGRSHVVTGFGTSARFGSLPTAGDVAGTAQDRLRLVTPLSFTAGYRGKFRSWGLDAFARLHVGTSERASSANPGGGHADFSGGGGLGLHFLYYADAAGMNSLYFGGGSTFELLRFALIRPADERISDPRAALWSGGLNVDLVTGYEFMRASAIHFYTEIEATLPTYVLEDDNGAGSISTYWPGVLAQVGILF
jgi:hypothetical protein